MSLVDRIRALGIQIKGIQIKGILVTDYREELAPGVLKPPQPPETAESFHERQWSLVRALNPDTVREAVIILREQLETVLPELTDRINEDREGWLGGRDNIPCDVCEATGLYQNLTPEALEQICQQVDKGHWQQKDYDFAAELREEPKNLLPPTRCHNCKGTGKMKEFPLHHGWGTSIRNLLRTKGFGEDTFGIDNLDDYYAVLVELACGFADPYMENDS